MARILWIGDGGCTTGFGRVTHAVGDRLVRDYGHDIHCLATNYQGDYWPTPIKLYVPNKLTQLDVYGLSRFVEMLGYVEPDVVFILNDPTIILKFLFRNQWDPDRRLATTTPLLLYVPVDGINQPPAWGSLADLRDTEVAVMAEWGKTLYPNATLAYHGVDTELFHPVSERPITTSGGMTCRTKRDCKRAFGFDPDDLLVLRVDRNSRRKDFASTWKALVPVLRRHPQVKVHFHCKGLGDDGYELPDVFSRDEATASRFQLPGSFSTRVGWPDQDMVALYNAADIFVSTSWGEGFGLGIAEASACGVPVVAPQNSAITEVVGPGGILVPPKELISVQPGQDQWLPDIEATTAAIERLVDSKGARRDLGEAGLAHVRSRFDWDKTTAIFDRLITDLAMRKVNPAKEHDYVGATA